MFPAPNDASTPGKLQLPSSRRPGQRALPRSPLFLSQNASSSPERRPTSSLTPRVASRVATHKTPSILFSQPPKRPPRPGGPASTTRTLRHQTNSFSFDSSERSSAAYEQERTVSSSTNGQLRGSDGVNLHDDLRGSSLQSSRNASAESSHVPPRETSDGGESSSRSEDEDPGTRTFIFSSPKLPLPPPFSTVSRSVSRAESLPSSPVRDHAHENPTTGPVRSSSTTPVRASTGPRDYSSQSGHAAQAAEHGGAQGSSPPVCFHPFCRYLYSDSE